MVDPLLFTVIPEEAAVSQGTGSIAPPVIARGLDRLHTAYGVRVRAVFTSRICSFSLVLLTASRAPHDLISGSMSHPK